MGLYSNVIFPRFLNSFMSSGQFKKQRSQLLSSVSGDILKSDSAQDLTWSFIRTMSGKSRRLIRMQGWAKSPNGI